MVAASSVKRASIICYVRLALEFKVAMLSDWTSFSHCSYLADVTVLQSMAEWKFCFSDCPEWILNRNQYVCQYGFVLTIKWHWHWDLSLRVYSRLTLLPHTHVAHDDLTVLYHVCLLLSWNCLAKSLLDDNLCSVAVQFAVSDSSGAELQEDGGGSLRAGPKHGAAWYWPARGKPWRGRFIQHGAAEQKQIVLKYWCLLCCHYRERKRERHTQRPADFSVPNTEKLYGVFSVM